MLNRQDAKNAKIFTYNSSLFFGNLGALAVGDIFFRASLKMLLIGERNEGPI